MGSRLVARGRSGATGWVAASVFVEENLDSYTVVPRHDSHVSEIAT